MLGEGSYGCTFYPPMQCENKKIDKKKYVSKFESYKDAKYENDIIEMVKNFSKKYIPNYRNYFLLSETMCRPHKLSEKEFQYYDSLGCSKLPSKSLQLEERNQELQDTKSLIIFRFGGDSLSSYFAKNAKKIITSSFFQTFHKNVLQLYQNGIKVLNDNNIYHTDIKLDNMVVLGQKYLLIDWGLTNKWFFTPYFVNNRSYTFFIFSDDFQQGLTPLVRSLFKLTSTTQKKKALAIYLSSFLLTKMKMKENSNYLFLENIFHKFSHYLSFFKPDYREYSYLSLLSDENFLTKYQSYFSQQQQEKQTQSKAYSSLSISKSLFMRFEKQKQKTKQNQKKGGKEENKRESNFVVDQTQKRKKKYIFSKNKVVGEGGGENASRMKWIHGKNSNEIHPVFLNYLVNFILTFISSTTWTFDFTRAENVYRKNIDMYGIIILYLNYLNENETLYKLKPQWFKTIGTFYFELFLNQYNVIPSELFLAKLVGIDKLR